MAHRYTLSQPQRDVFDTIVLKSVRSGKDNPTSIADDAAQRLKSLREDWATILARAFNFKHSVVSSLERLKHLGLIERGPQEKRGATWLPRGHVRQEEQTA
jgi:hypothetical protein